MAKDQHSEAVESAPPWVLVQERRIATELMREVQCHQQPAADCRICQLKAEWNRLNPSLGAIV